MTSHPVPLRDLFEALLALAPDARERHLALRDVDADTRARLHGMLAADAAGSHALEQGASAIAGAVIRPATGFVVGASIGGFELVEILGEGGSSIVFRAQRGARGVRQEVALKLLHRPMFSDEAQRQFRRERLALSQLNHPGIARLIEGGVTDTGIAYIALDLVRGRPITEYAREHRCDLQQRLRLFVQVCRAVEAAHRALIVHRDLKPPNIFVDEDGEVKLLDFGVAKLLDADEQTQTRLPSFTPAYAAPEQHRGGPITTATDVYALGIVLGELVTGERFNDGSGQTPSGRLGELEREPGVLPAPLRVTRRQLRGDLDNIVLKAISAEPEQRYASAGAFAQDIEAVLEGRPVAAHPPSTMYRMRKFVARHKGGVASTVALLLAVFAALGVALWQAGVARREAHRAGSVRDFLVDVFDTAGSNVPREQRPTPEDLVRGAAGRVQADASIEPAQRADLLRTLGRACVNLRAYPQAITLLDAAMQAEFAGGVPASSPEALETRVQKATALHRTDHNVEADALLSALLPQLRLADTATAVQGLRVLGETRFLTGKAEDAFALTREAAQKAVRVLPADSPAAAAMSVQLGELDFTARRFADAVAELDPVIARWREHGIARNGDFATAVSMLAGARAFTGDNTGADAAYRESIVLRRRIFAGPSDDLASSLAGYASFLTNRVERFDEAQPLLEEAIEIGRKVHGADSDDVAYTLDVLGTLQAARRHFDDSERSLREALRIYAAHVGESGDIEDLSLARGHLATTLIQLGRLDEAAALADTARNDVRARFGEEGDLYLGVTSVVGRIALARHDATGALALADEGLAILARAKTPSSRLQALLHDLRGAALGAVGRREDALADTDIAIAAMREALPNLHARLIPLLARRTRLLQALGRIDDASRTSADARALDVPVALLSPEDVATLGLSQG